MRCLLHSDQTSHLPFICLHSSLSLFYASRRPCVDANHCYVSASHKICPNYEVHSQRMNVRRLSQPLSSSQFFVSTNQTSVHTWNTVYKSVRLTWTILIVCTQTKVVQTHLITLENYSSFTEWYPVRAGWHAQRVTEANCFKRRLDEWQECYCFLSRYLQVHEHRKHERNRAMRNKLQ